MADISQYLQAIMQAVYGEEVRGSIHDAIEIINDVSEVILTTGTAVTSASSSSTGFFTDSLYLNTNTYDLWKCVGTDSWTLQGNLKGTQGLPGEDGNKWYIGTAISGKSTNPTVFVNSGIAEAVANDCYLNKTEGAVYHCETGGAPSVATWVYDLTMSGGGGGGTYTAGNGISISNADVISIDPGTITSGNTKPITGGDAYTALSAKADASSVPDELKDLTGDVSIVGTPSNGDVLTFSTGSGKWGAQAPSGGGHTMVPNTSYISTMIVKATDATDDDVISAYAAANWSNCDAIEILTPVSQNDDGLGAWADNWKESGASRSGWLWAADLYGVLSDDSIKVEPVFVIPEDEVIGLYAMRIDDSIVNSGVNGGAVAFKFTGEVQTASGVKVGVRLTKQRTKVKIVSPLT